ncbi:biotin--[acetyl-CoA-carboxylase] ligase [Nitratifractor sp.]
MEIRSFERIESTQRWLVEAIRDGRITEACAVIAAEQSAGEGSRGNRWIARRGDLLTSVALPESALPEDLPVAATSIYFAWLMREALRPYDPRVWVKWPNDLYRDGAKVGGVITRRLRGFVVAGIGVNLSGPREEFASLRIGASARTLLENFLKRCEDPPSWKKIFSSFRIEFEKSRPYAIHAYSGLISLQNARLMGDGTVQIDGERIVCQR